ncbi:hypothetical protein D3C81_1209290 [compost metagenome]|uniref:DUF1345 domain-containing protein n=1 Tax=Sphingobacterium paramultivorum TaxID=2886510 RepID=A0A7G5E0U2_9SPHI|nr:MULTISPECIES: DUF1345 domain-containing protein [Sphingobacterium]MBB1643379.1 hypothetical protein [Sphingobacterium sp. UME9]MCS4165103.1 putative membrane protein [Sphingobacterium sp. BIGb0116]QMV67617.1 DUF1345 domain-containing protein [Sphingobacterium paramultivorum]WSO16495.1 DUF1345 domain-containing protein [Sphingobacterium paramultivorum]
MGKINYYLHRMQSIHRALISVCIFLLIYFISPIKTIPLLNLMLCWFGFCLSYVFISWYIFYTTPISTIARKAQQEDGSRLFVSLFIILVTIGCFISVLMIIISSKDKQLNDAYIIIICMLAMLASWILVHTIYTFHYARLYYEHNAGGTGLEFPGDDQPDYLDFAYFSFVMGCTFQVSDVGVSSKKIRRVALFHGLLSFALNTFVVALTINIISGLIN